MKIKKEITRGLGAVSACLLTVVSIGTPVAEAYEGRLNTVLGIETTKTVSDEGLDVDTDYYKSDYGTDIYDGESCSSWRMMRQHRQLQNRKKVLFF